MMSFKLHMTEDQRSSMVTKLIEEVRKRPQLWNPHHYLHHTRPLIGDNWEEIAHVIGSPSKLYTNSRLLSMSNASLTPANLVKTKWKGLRDNFRKEVKKCLRMGDAYIPWIHFKACSFLWNVLDTSQLECTQEQIEELKQKWAGDQGDPYEQFDNRFVENPSGDNSMDFHDYIFADEVPVDELLKQEKDQQLLNASYEPEEGEIITGDNDDGNDDEAEVQIIEPVIEQVEVPDDDDDDEEDISTPSLRITQPRSLVKTPVKKFTPIRIVKKVNYQSIQPTKPELKPTQNHPTKVISKPVINKNDSDLHFLKSVLPYLKQINSKRKSHVKERIEQMLRDEISKDNDESSKKQKLESNEDFDVGRITRNGTKLKKQNETNIS